MAGCNVQANDRQVGGSHYRSKIQHWDYVLANEIPYLEAMVIKYLTRWRLKGGHEDIRKAQHFLEKLMETEGVSEGEISEGPISGNSGLQQQGLKQDSPFGQQISASFATQTEQFDTPTRKHRGK